MPLRPMPIFNEVYNRAALHDILTGRKLGPDEWKYEEQRNSAIEGFKLDAQVAAELYYRGTQQTYDLRRHFGSLRLPYPTMWFEWDLPPIVNLMGKEVPVGHSVRHAALLCEVPNGDYLELAATLFHFAAGRLSAPLVFDMVRLDQAGNFIERAHLNGYRDEEFVSRAHMTGIGRGTKFHVSEMLGDLNVAYLAISLMHCKNVRAEKVEAKLVGSRDPRKRKRNRGVDYHTIVLPGMSGGSSSGTEYQDVMALHRVRGHFKTYTAEAPLLGKYTGTYWWGWQVRGNKKNGISVTDYKIGDAARAERVPA